MSRVRVLVGTRKGAFILTADGKRQRWDVSGPHFGGWEIHHIKGSAVDPNRLYASQYTGWFGQVIQRSDDGGKTWRPPASPSKSTTMPEASVQGQSPLIGEILTAARQKACGSETSRGESNRFVYDASPGTGRPLTAHPIWDGTVRPWEFKRVWRLEPSPTDPEVVYAGVEDAALFRSTDGGHTWRELPALREQYGAAMIPGNGGLCLHTVLFDAGKPDRIVVAISAAGAFRTDDGGRSWKPINRGLSSNFLPDPKADIGHCVHSIARHPSRPDVLFMQKHWDVMRSDDAGESWRRISGNLPTDFGFPIVVHAHEPDTVYVVPIKSDSEHYPPEGKLRVFRSRTGGNEWEPLTRGLPQENCYVNVLRGAMAVDALDQCGVYFGTTAGQVYASADAGDNWTPIIRDLPAVLSVEVQTLS
ncbi:MAG: hypothetical protein U0793_03280 [Gemmataceae bacterium]